MKKETPHPSETVSAVRRFCLKHAIPFQNVKNVSDLALCKGQVWFTIRDSDLVEVIKISREQGLLPRKRCWCAFV
jgi:hypothetical protein